jgi:signal transduction histidine kinase
MMRVRLTLTFRYTLFLAGIMLLMLMGAHFITMNSIQNGLHDLFEQRLSYAGETLTHFTSWHLLNRWNELHSLANSPRFMAAIQTGDPETIDQEVPGYLLQIKAELFVILNKDGDRLFASQGLDHVAKIHSFFESPLVKDTVVLLSDNGETYEVFLTQLVTVDGYVLGNLAAGYHFQESIPNDVSQLTGFDVVFAHRGSIIGHNKSELLNRILIEGAWKPVWEVAEATPGDAVINGEKIIYQTRYLPALQSNVTLVASIDEHITPILKKQVQQMIYLAAFAALAGILVVYLFVRRRIGRQVRFLVEATDRIAEDDMDSPIHSTSRDEFGYLARQLDKMRHRLVENRQELEKAHEERVRATRLATVGQLAAGIIHDFKNPISVIRGMAELLTAVTNDDKRLVKWCGMISEQVDRMTELTRDILEYSRGKCTIDLENVNLSEYLHKCCDIYQNEVNHRKITLKLIGDTHCRVSLDPGRFRRVLDNLVRNAIQILLPGGTVKILWQTTDAHIEIAVCDDGPGIPPDILETLFEPFVTSGKKHGTGLGLAISKKIVEDHGGEISISTEVNKGTCFTIRMPLNEAHVDTSREQREAVEEIAV